MRKILVLLFLVLVPVWLAAQTKDVKKAVRKYDLPYLRSAIVRDYPSEFWGLIMMKDKGVLRYNKAREKGDKTLSEAYSAIVCADANIQPDILVGGYNKVLSRLVSDLGIEKITERKPIRVIYDNEINASMDYDGQMRINLGCFTRLSYKELLAVCAHEMAHYYCKHVVLSVWKTARKQKRNRMWADIGSSLAIGAIAATSAYGAYNGQDMSYYNNIISNADILYNNAYNYADNATLKYRYRYNREEETQADIIAYRFMEQMGYGGDNVLSLLKKIMKFYGDTPSGKYNDHPSTLFRIEVISLMMSGLEK